MGIFSNLFSGKKSTVFPFRDPTALQGLFLCGETREIPIGPAKEKFILLFTDGLRKYGQQEICICIPEKQYQPKHRVEWQRFMETVCQYAANARFVRHGDISIIQPAMFGFANGFIYAEPGPRDKSYIPEDFLMAIVLNGAEAQALRNCNPARMLALYGRLKQYFPYPFWSEMNRPQLPVKGMEQSMFNGLYRERVEHAYLTKEQNSIILRISPSANQEQLQKLAGSGERPFCMYFSCSPAADSCLVWYPDSSGPEAIGPHNSPMERLSLLSLAVLQEEENKGVLVEDGFALILQPEQLNACIHALTNRQNLDITLSGEYPVFSLKWETVGAKG